MKYPESEGNDMYCDLCKDQIGDYPVETEENEFCSDECKDFFMAREAKRTKVAKDAHDRRVIICGMEGTSIGQSFREKFLCKIDLCNADHAEWLAEEVKGYNASEVVFVLRGAVIQSEYLTYNEIGLALETANSFHINKDGMLITDDMNQTALRVVGKFDDSMYEELNDLWDMIQNKLVCP